MPAVTSFNNRTNSRMTRFNALLAELERNIAERETRRQFVDTHELPYDHPKAIDVRIANAAVDDARQELRTFVNQIK